MAKRYLTVDEQRARVRNTAINTELGLLARIEAGETTDLWGEYMKTKLDDVQAALDLIQRKQPFSEDLAIRMHNKYVAEQKKAKAEENELRERSA